MCIPLLVLHCNSQYRNETNIPPYVLPGSRLGIVNIRFIRTHTCSYLIFIHMLLWRSLILCPSPRARPHEPQPITFVWTHFVGIATRALSLGKQQHVVYAHNHHQLSLTPEQPRHQALYVQNTLRSDAAERNGHRVAIACISGSHHKRCQYTTMNHACDLLLYAIASPCGGVT